MRLVVNSSPLIQLKACRQLELLRNLAGQVLVPRAVLRELEAGAGRDQAADAVSAAAWITLVDDLPLPQFVASWDLGAGESQVLAAAAQLPTSIVVLDDRAARNCAMALQLPVVGTLGLLVAAKEKNLLQAIRPLIQELLCSGLYISEKVISTALRQADES